MTNRMPRWPVLLVLLALAAAPRTGWAQSDLDQVATPAPTPTVLEQPALVQQYQATITPEDLASHLYLFASDLFEGRETTTRGQKLAATYLASQYRKAGLAPMGTAHPDDPMAPEAYFQPFSVYGRRLQQAQLQVQAGGAEVASVTFSPETQSGDAFLTYGNAAEVSAPVVFAGYGIPDADRGYDDYAALQEAGIAHQGKWLLFLRDEPLADAETSLLSDDGSVTDWTTNSSSKLRALFSRGLPAGILIVGDVGPRVDQPMAQRAAEAAQGSQGVGNLSLQQQAGGFAFPPIYTISTELADQILAPSGRTVAELKAQIDETLEPTVFEVEGATVESELAFETYEAQTENVLAFIEGSDPELKDEVVVISSHYDHIGVDPLRDGDQINNGADDDGSGTVALLEIAEAFMQAKRDGHGPRRSILFINVSGEEKGLLGSAYYSDIEPVLPLDQTVTNLNIDMIGRFDPTHPAQSENYVYIIGSNLISQELHDLNAQVNEVTGVELELDERFNSKDDPNQFYRRSDHWNFGKHGIPFIFFFTGTHEDYHQPGDEAHKIEYDRMARIARLIFATGWQVANQDAPPAVSGTGFN